MQFNMFFMPLNFFLWSPGIQKNISQCVIRHILRSVINTITPVLKVSTCIITSVTARSIGLSEILVIMSVSTFKMLLFYTCILFLIVNIFTGKIAITLILGWRLNECLWICSLFSMIALRHILQPLLYECWHLTSFTALILQMTCDL